MNKRKWQNIIAVLLVLLVILVPVTYVQANQLIYADRVKEYLIQQKHYREQDIASVQGVWGMKMPDFYVKVIFRDEPYATYIYYAHRPVIQTDVWPTGGEISRPANSGPLRHLEK